MYARRKMGLEPIPLQSQYNVLPVKLLPFPSATTNTLQWLKHTMCSEPLGGVEPTPYGLQNQRSTIKLKGQRNNPRAVDGSRTHMPKPWIYSPLHHHSATTATCGGN